MAKKKMTIEGLATLMQREFRGIGKDMATKEELQNATKGLATKDELRNLATKGELLDFRKDMTESLRILHEDVKDIKGSLGPLVRVVAAQESEMKNLHIRVYRLERKAGLAK